MVKMMFLTGIVMVLISCSTDEGSESEPQFVPKISISDVEKLEGDDGLLQFDYIITIDRAYSQDIKIPYASEDGSAFSGSDYKRIGGQVVIPAGSLEGIISLELVSDKIKEGNEVFYLKFSAPEGVEINSPSATISIKNDDSLLPYGDEDYSTPTFYDGWNMVWADEFSGSEINQEWWTHEIGGDGWGNNELEYYTDGVENSRIEEGNLVIEARNDAWNGNTYTSARLITKEKKSFSFSRTDIRAKLPYGQGIWPALWMLGINIDEKGWPACGEIDIMELVGHEPSKSHSTVHFGLSFPENYFYQGHFYNLGESFNDRFHVFSVVREFNQIWFYVDDIMIYEFTSKDTNGMPYPFNEEFFFIFNVAVGGNWPGSPDDTTVFPQRMLVDYIRVFEKNG